MLPSAGKNLLKRHRTEEAFYGFYHFDWCYGLLFGGLDPVFILRGCCPRMNTVGQAFGDVSWP